MSAPRTRLPGETVFSVLMLMLSAFLLWAAIDISGFKSYTSAGSYPMAAAATMLVCSLIVVAQTARAQAGPAEPGESAWRAFVRRIAPPVVVNTSLAIAAYMLTLEWLGFVVASYAFLAVTMRLLGSARWGLNLLVSALVLGAIYLVFQTVFSVVLPAGRLWQGFLA
jgi:putative tricarboxylic transport membrane protein